MAHENPTFSVVMPAYNRQDLIAHSVASVLNQHFEDFELLIVDDGSSDQTLEVLSQIADSRITVLTQKNAGPGAARNKGIHAAKGQYIAFLDSDDLFMPWTLAMYNKVIAQHDQPAMLFGKMKDFVDPAELESITQEPMVEHVREDYLLAEGFDAWVGSSVICVNRVILLKTGGFCKAKVNQEDCDLWLRMGAYPGFVAIEKPICAGRRWHDGNVSHQIQKSIDGINYLLSQFKNKAYSQRSEHRKRLREMLARNIRPVSLDCIKAGCRKDALSLYLRTWGWNLRLGRMRYLLGFWLRFISGRGSR